MIDQAFQLAKERYYSELESRYKLTALLQLPLGVMTAISGMVGYLALELLSSRQWEQAWSEVRATEVLCIAIGLVFISILVCAFCLFKSYHGLGGYAYEHLETPSVYRNYRQGLVEYYGSLSVQDRKGKEPKEAAEQEATEHLHAKIDKAIERNFKNNTLKSLWLHRANIALSVMVVATVIASVAFVLHESTERRLASLSKSRTPITSSE